MFDVDGTLVKSLAVEARCFPRACEDGLGISGVSNDWGGYRHPTDAGIVAELAERHLNRPARAEDFEKVEQRLLQLLKEAFANQPCEEVPGARRAFQRAAQLPSTVIAIATGGWRTTARLKLQTAGFELAETVLASAHDAATKREIMEIGRKRLLQERRMDAFASMTYVGDSAGDAHAADALGFHFIGMDTSGFLPDAAHRFENFTDHDAFFDIVLKIQDSAHDPEAMSLRE